MKHTITLNEKEMLQIIINHFKDKYKVVNANFGFKPTHISRDGNTTRIEISTIIEAEDKPLADYLR